MDFDGIEKELVSNSRNPILIRKNTDIVSVFAHGIYLWLRLGG
jgi:hypothetical protein